MCLLDFGAWGKIVLEFGHFYRVEKGRKKVKGRVDFSGRPFDPTQSAWPLPTLVNSLPYGYLIWICILFTRTMESDHWNLTKS